MLEIALRVGLALGQNHKSVVVGRDTRTSGNALKLALESGLMSAGAEPVDAGIVPTPTLAFAARKFDAGIMITASHNPPQYNGLKIFNPDGSSYFETQQTELERLLSGPLPTATWEGMAEKASTLDTAVSDHARHIKSQVTPASRIKMVVDCSCGAASVMTPYLLREMGFEVVGLNTHTSGFFPHDVEPIESNLGDLIRVCRSLNVVGIAHDGDADRMMAVDEQGRFIPGDTLLILMARFLDATEIVTTVDASMAIEDSGLKPVRTKVGDTYVSEQLLKGGTFGGEPSGAWVFPRNSLCPDGIFAAALFAAMASRQQISSMVDAIPRYPILRGSVPTSDGWVPDFRDIAAILGASDIDETDGAKIKVNDGWVLVRPSGTEPKIRITAEARTKDRAQQLYNSTIKAIEQTQIQRRGQA
jgi:phosphoglucosamine mutase